MTRILLALTLLTLASCGGSAPVAPGPTAGGTNVNPETGTRPSSSR